MRLKSISILTGILFLASLFTYYFENQRGRDLVKGSYYIKGIDIEDTHKLSITSPSEGRIILSRENERFFLSNYKSYPASNGPIHDLFYKLANIKVDQLITEFSGKPNSEELEKYNLDEQSYRYKIQIFNATKKQSLSFIVGASKKNEGSYLFKQGGRQVYLSREPLDFSLSLKTYINKNLLVFDPDKVKKLSLKYNAGISLVKTSQGYSSSRPSSFTIDTDKVNSYLNSLRSLGFNDFFHFDEDEVKSIRFYKDIVIRLDNRLTYRIGLTQKDGKGYLKLSALVDDIPEDMVISQNDDKEKLSKVEAMVRAQAQAEAFNILRGGWIFEIDSEKYEELLVDDSYFIKKEEM